ncbi:MAG: type II secretion system F family protein [Candidatus Diapherotrites archaeon]
MREWNGKWKQYCERPAISELARQLKPYAIFIAAGMCIAVLAFTAYGVSWTKSIALSLALGLGAVSLVFALPFIEERKRREELEGELPFALLSLAVQLEFGNAFEKALENVSKEKHGLVSKAFGEILEEAKRGKSIPKAIAVQAEQWKSRLARRAFLNVKSSYESGNREGGGNALKALAKEMLERQHAQSKQFSGKMVLLALLFVTISAIVPALFLSFLVVGSQFLDVSISPTQALVAVCVGFPLLDVAMLFFIRSQTPYFLRQKHA